MDSKSSPSLPEGFLILSPGPSSTSRTELANTGGVSAAGGERLVVEDLGNGLGSAVVIVVLPFLVCLPFVGGSARGSRGRR